MQAGQCHRQTHKVVLAEVAAEELGVVGEAADFEGGEVGPLPDHLLLPVVVRPPAREVGHADQHREQAEQQQPGYGGLQVASCAQCVRRARPRLTLTTRAVVQGRRRKSERSAAFRLLRDKMYCRGAGVGRGSAAGTHVPAGAGHAAAAQHASLR